MKVLLVNPPVNRLCDVPMNYFPLGLGYLAAITEGMGHATFIYNGELETRPMPFPTNKVRIENHALFAKALADDNHLAWREFRQVVEQVKPDIVGFSCTSASILPCLKMAADAKRSAGSSVVLGGMHPTILPEETAREENVDYIVVGDAEKSFARLVGNIEKGVEPSDIPGVGMFRRGRFVFSPSCGPERDIDAFPFPRRDALVDIDKHRPYLQAVIGSRGCPYRCTFCSGRNITGGVTRYRSAGSIIEEIVFLKERYSVNAINFYDDALLVSKKRVKELCEEMLHQKISIPWTGFTRADSVDEETLALMKRSGCAYLGIGVESGSDRVLEKIKKGYTREQAIHGINLIKKSGIDVSINIIVGFPFETEHDIRDSIDLIKKLGVPANVNTFTPYPKTEIYEECVQRGLIKDGVDWMSISQHSIYNQFVQEVGADLYKRLLGEMIAVSDEILLRHETAAPRLSPANVVRGIKQIWEEERHNPIRFGKRLTAATLRRIRSVK